MENRQTLVQKTMEIMNESIENQKLLDSWANVFIEIVPKLDLDYLIDEVLDQLYPHMALNVNLNQWIWAANMIYSVAKVSTYYS